MIDDYYNFLANQPPIRNFDQQAVFPFEELETLEEQLEQLSSLRKLNELRIRIGIIENLKSR